MFRDEKTSNNNVLGVLYFYVSLLQYFIIKPSLPRTSNLRDSTVFVIHVQTTHIEKMKEPMSRS